MWHQIDIVNDENSHTVANHKTSHNLGPIYNGPNKTSARYAYFIRFNTGHHIGYAIVTSNDFELSRFSYMHLQRLSMILCTRYNAWCYP